MVQRNMSPILISYLTFFVFQSYAYNALLQYPSVRDCLANWALYSAESSQLATKSYTTTLTSTEIWSVFPSVPTSTFCDSIPRLLSRQHSAYVTEWFPTTTYTTWSTMTSPTPSCRVKENECEVAISGWSSLFTATPSASFPFPCTTYQPCSADPIGPCSITAESVKIYYWPTIASSPLCSQTTTLASAAQPTPPPSVPKSPLTKVIDGFTATSPSVYISFPFLYGRYHGQPTHIFTGCGSMLTSVTLSIPPWPISTVTRVKGARRPLYRDPRPFNLSSLNWPVTTTSSCAIQTSCQWSDLISGCIDVLYTKCTTPTVDPFHWNPVLALPTHFVGEAAKKDPGYAKCEIHPAAAAAATWIPITTLAGDPRFTEGWSATPTMPQITVTETAAITST
ncbi:uncharacterized protein BDR25DRAFT_313099 [Lindgomyces ingoldianus]|uniref:Uncharacterized protein n=1 Tax=Lindgomyces ingoldianus TaxID=673940 RepID=A0ACB6R2P4_9PLEO|nr:uncharacterized protein BDR25DRAFT_313099 [Lindgomyces ingoldianus]KAF2472595.1 hypothetical protein BDR25DRAFT_313099 [Lindgomyces ingoldianus]